jgi:acyl-coenzyme A synthetase/AMP-(fatty) acid ligase
MPPDLARRWLALYPDIPLLNAYGPAECSDDVSWSRLDRRWAAGERHQVTLGRPLANVALHVVGPALGPQPIGVAGEIAVGGLAVGRGYLRDPRRTAAAFVPDPLAGEPGVRLYRTGDLGRRLADGEIEFLGRVDHQVKVRGLRIEPGEVEAALAGHPGVAEAAVVARDLGGETHLVAYYAGRPGSAPSGPEVRRFLRERVPDYMVPTMTVELDALPRNRNGKLDRAALPEPAADGGGETRAYLAPRTPVEGIVADIWSEVLGIEPVGRGDDFFALGGHSLLATQALSRMRDAFEVELELRQLFEAPTVAAAAEIVERRRREGIVLQQKVVDALNAL